MKALYIFTLITLVFGVDVRKEDNFLGKNYVFFESPWLNYTDAIDKCKTITPQHTLAKIPSITVKLWLETSFADIGLRNKNYFIGCDELDNYGYFEWQDGTTCAPNQNITYTDWAFNEPDNDDQSCVQARAAKLGSWADVYCWDPASFLCSGPPTHRPTKSPTLRPTRAPTPPPSPIVGTHAPTFSPTKNPTDSPTNSPTTPSPTLSPTNSPTTAAPSESPTNSPTTPAPTNAPTETPSRAPIIGTHAPSLTPTKKPTDSPSQTPTHSPTKKPTDSPTKTPTTKPTDSPTNSPTKKPTISPTTKPTEAPTDLVDPYTEQPPDIDTEAPTTDFGIQSTPTSAPTSEKTSMTEATKSVIIFVSSIFAAAILMMLSYILIFSF